MALVHIIKAVFTEGVADVASQNSQDSDSQKKSPMKLSGSFLKKIQRRGESPGQLRKEQKTKEQKTSQQKKTKKNVSIYRFLSRIFYVENVAQLYFLIRQGLNLPSLKSVVELLAYCHVISRPETKDHYVFLFI